VGIQVEEGRGKVQDKQVQVGEEGEVGSKGEEGSMRFLGQGP